MLLRSSPSQAAVPAGSVWDRAASTGLEASPGRAHHLGSPVSLTWAPASGACVTPQRFKGSMRTEVLYRISNRPWSLPLSHRLQPSFSTQNRSFDWLPTFSCLGVEYKLLRQRPCRTTETLMSQKIQHRVSHTEVGIYVSRGTG